VAPLAGNAYQTATFVLRTPQNTNGAINSGSVNGLGEIIVGNTAGVNAVRNITGGTVVATQWPSLATKPALTNCLRGGKLTMNWPLANTGYRLLVQTNNLNGGVSGNPADWAEVPGSAATNQACLTLFSTNVNEFYRWVYP